MTKKKMQRFETSFETHCCIFKLETLSQMEKKMTAGEVEAEVEAVGMILKLSEGLREI